MYFCGKLLVPREVVAQLLGTGLALLIPAPFPHENSLTEWNDWPAMSVDCDSI